MCSSRVIKFIRVRLCGQWVHTGSLVSLCCALDSSGVVTFTLVRPGGRWFRPGSLGSLALALRVVEFIRGRWVHWRTLGVDWFKRGCWVHLHAPWESSGSSGVNGLTRACLACHWVQPGSLGLLVHAVVVVRFIRGRWVHSRRCGVRWVHPGSLGSFTRPACLLVHSGSLGSLARSWWSLGSSGVFGFAFTRPPGGWGNLGCRWIHSGSLCSLAGCWWSLGSPGSLDSLTLALGLDGLILHFDGFIRCR